MQAVPEGCLSIVVFDGLEKAGLMAAMVRLEILLRRTGALRLFLAVKEVEEWDVGPRTQIGVTSMAHFMAAVVEEGLVPTSLVRLVIDQGGLAIRA